MNPDELHYLIALLKIDGVGPVVAKNLVAYCGGARAVFQKPKGWLLKVPEVGPKLVEALTRPAVLKEAETEMEFCQKQGVKLMHYLAPEYPEYLKTIYDAPLILFQKGNLDLNAQPSVAIVGTRKATAYGRRWATHFAEAFVRAGLNVVSGLAYGIDIEAHKAVLDVGGKTTAVLAHGLDMIYPTQHARHAEAITERGALLSEYFIGAQPKANHFPQRNRILSGMCRAVVVIEAADKGGATLTARIAFDQNREVYAIPGNVESPFSKGCNRLIRDLIAKLVLDPQEVLDDLDLVNANAARPRKAQATNNTEPQGFAFRTINEPLSADEQRVLNVLSETPTTADQVADRSGLGISDLMPALLGLEFKGLVGQQPGWKYVRR